MASYEEIFEQALEQMGTGESYQESIESWKIVLSMLSDTDEADFEERLLVSLNLGLCYQSLGQAGMVQELFQPYLEGDEPLLAHSDESAQHMLSILVTVFLKTGALGQARVYSEAAFSALEGDFSECSLPVLVSSAKLRAELAREMEQPDDAEDSLQFVLDILKEELKLPELDSEALAEVSLLRADLLETRAHNRWQGQASEIAELDLEDAVQIYASVLGPEDPRTRQAEELREQVRSTI